MKNILSVGIGMMCFSFISPAQQPQIATQLLKQPATWSFERFALPPDFAPGFPYKGVEELRFSPGMFNKDSNDYFTYAFVAQLENANGISQNDIRNYLLEYFKGLCSSTAKERKLSIDISKITVIVEKKNSTNADETIYNASLNIFGVFADGAPVKLNMEVKALKDDVPSKIYLVFIASPREKNDTVWQELYKIQKDFTLPLR